MHVLVLDAHPIFRRGVVSSLEQGLRGDHQLYEAGSVSAARDHPDLPRIDVALVDHAVLDACAFIRQSTDSGVRVIVYSASCAEAEVRDALRSGAAGVLAKRTLTPEVLVAALHASAEGTGVLAPELLAVLVGAEPHAAERPAPVAGRPVLTTRERHVLRLLAGGHATRDVARELSYSERTVKNVLHDAVTKLDAKSRSQAIAHAVRDGLI